LALKNHQTPYENTVGIILAGLSLIVMPLLAWGKIKAAAQIQSQALKAEAKETIACSLLSLILLVGLAADALLGWWWADPVAGLCMIPWLVKEGLAGIKGEGCCG
jgi:divalent metal cation (Fe/Co/Zn/Cd) transporter